MKRLYIFATLAFLGGAIVGGSLSWAIFRPTKPALDMVVYTAIRLGWVCHDNNVTFDECTAMATAVARADK